MIYEDLIVVLEEWELQLAAAEAARRWASAEARAKRDRASVENSADMHVAGVCGEVAVAKWAGRYWTAGKRAAGDVGGLEVRTRRSDARDERPLLLIQPYDEKHKPDAPFVLVVGQGATYRVVGHSTPRRARELQRLGGVQEIDPGNRGRPCLGVPQPALLPMDEFRVPEVVAAVGVEA